MKIHIEENEDYDTGYHPDVTRILFKRKVVGDFFKDDRFPNLVELVCLFNELTELKLNCPSLQILNCYCNRLTNLELNCPSLQNLNCAENNLTKLKLNCPSLQILNCSRNNLTKLKLNCSSLQELNCSTNKLIELKLNCPSLQKLYCYANQLTNLNGLEFCEKLSSLKCSHQLKESVKILESFIPELDVKYER
jgi:Leucine-rich repeat (LRR) protein